MGCWNRRPHHCSRAWWLLAHAPIEEQIRNLDMSGCTYLVDPSIGKCISSGTGACRTTR
jgi:hypothetical protein